MKSLFSAAEIQSGVERLAQRVTRDYGDKHLTIIGVMSGSIPLVADLIRQIDLPMQVGVLQARSYRGNNTLPGELVIRDEMLPTIAGRDVLLVDDIFDTGRTMTAICKKLEAMQPASLRTAVLLRKAARCEVDMRPDEIVFEAPNEFVIGYGLDYQEQYRNLPFVATLEPSEIAAAATTS